MKKKVFTLAIVVTILTTPIVSLTACDPVNDNGGIRDARDLYAMSAVSSISYLSENSVTRAATVGMRASGVTLAAPRKLTADEASQLARPTHIDEQDVEGIQNCLTAFDSILTGGGIDQTVKDNVSEDPLFSDYQFAMTISFPANDALSYTLYFNETGNYTETEVDDGEEEREETTTFAGVVAVENELFVVEGEREVEIEGKETETSIEFRTYKNVGTESVQADRSNYVVVSQSVERDEIEYEYTFYKNGKKVQEIELEYEEDRRGAEVSFQIKDMATGVKNETEYEMRKGDTDGSFVVKLEKNGKRDTVTVTQLSPTSYQFRYSNGFEETVNV